MTTQTPITLITNLAGEANNIVPRLCRLYCPNNTVSQLLNAGFLDDYLKANSISLLPTDFIAAVASDGQNWYKPVFTNGSCQLFVLL